MGFNSSMPPMDTQRSQGNLFHQDSVRDLGVSPGFQSLSLVQVSVCTAALEN